MKCAYCGNTVKVMVRKGSDVCSELCEKALAGKLTHEQWEIRKQHAHGQVAG